MECKDCKHWHVDQEGQHYRLIGAGECTRAKQFWDSTEWEEFQDEETGEIEVKRVKVSTDDLHFVQDGSDYRATLITLPEFGCNQFKAKE